MAKYFIEDTTLTNIADAIRAKEGTTEAINAEDFPGRIEALPSGGDTSIEDGLVQDTLTEYTNNRVTTIANRKFAYSSNLKNVTFGAVTSVGQFAFQNCGLEEASFPSLVKATQASFQYCGFTKILSRFFPALEVIEGNYAFANCSSLRFAEFSKVGSIGYVSFRDCKVLDTLILRNSTLCTLSNTQNLVNTPIASGAGYVYVPSALLEEYKVATNWVTYAVQIRAIEDWQERIDITTQPTDASVAVGDSITFNVVADGMGLEYQWQISKDNGNTWTSSKTTSSKTNSYKVDVLQSYNGYKIKCVITNIEDYSVETDVVTLTVTE